MLEKTVRCPICGQPYKVYSHTTADQSACPVCVHKAERLSKPKWVPSGGFLLPIR